MTPERIKEFAALSATSSLECPDAAAWARLLKEGNVLAWTELAANRQVLATVALAECPPRKPPAALKERILARARASAASLADQLPSPRGTDLAHPKATAPAFHNIRKEEGPWLPTPLRGFRVKLLSRDPARNSALIYAEIDAGAGYPSHDHSASEEIYVLTGDLRVNGITLQAGDFHHAEGHTHHEETFSINGCTALLLVPADSLNL